MSQQSLVNARDNNNDYLIKLAAEQDRQVRYFMKTNNLLFQLLVYFAAFSCAEKNDRNKTEFSQESEFSTPTEVRAIIAEDTVVMNALADSLYSERQYLEAIDIYLDLAKVDSLNGMYWYRIGYCLGQAQKMRAALVYYKKSANLGYREFESNKAIGVIYLLVLKDKSNAATYFEKCKKLDPMSNEPDSLWAIYGTSQN